MFDLHTHILPQLDDGAKNIEESLEMLNQARTQGVKLCAATPHCVVHKNTDIEDFLKKREASYRLLKANLKDDTIPLILGAEVYLDNDISQYKDIKKLCIENTSVMLIELPQQSYSEHFVDWIYSLVLLGIHPLIAHIDRYHEQEIFINDLEGINVTFQINSSRFLSFRGRKIVKKLLLMCENVLVSSDMHNTSIRCCNMKRAFEVVQKKYPSFLKKLFYDTAANILHRQKGPHF